MKKILYLGMAAAMMLASCEDFLDTENYTQKNTGNYPQTATDAEQIITGIYNNLNVANANPQFTFFYYSELASDDRLGGGGFNDQLMQSVDLLMNFGNSMYTQFYQDRYKGIFRANTALETLDNCEGVPEETLRQYKGEAYFLRAYYYYELASMFGNIPCPVQTVADPTLPQISGEPLWGQILQDLRDAIEIMPTKAQMGSGHVDKYCAQALLGRAYLFYSGFYNDDTVSCPDGSEITKDYVTQQINDCVQNSGYSLVPNYYNLWSYTNRCTVEDELSPYKGKGLKWVSDDYATNPEAMFMIKFNTQPEWSTTIGYSNQYALHFGVRGGQDAAATFPFGQGWGAGPVAPNLYNDWVAAEPNDIRRDASIQNVKNFPNYQYGAAGWNDYAQETDYFAKKIAPVVARKDDGVSFWASFMNAMDPSLTWSSGNEDNFQLNSIEDMVLIRFAEVLLMQSELTGTADGMNRVRARAGLEPVAYSVEALRNERRWELAFEGIRWNDIRRYGVDYAKAALDKQNNVNIYLSGVPGTNNVTGINGGYGARYEATKGFAPLPDDQIALSAQAGEQYKYTQNAGWGIASSEYGGWPR